MSHNLFNRIIWQNSPSQTKNNGDYYFIGHACYIINIVSLVWLFSWKEKRIRCYWINSRANKTHVYTCIRWSDDLAVKEQVKKERGELVELDKSSMLRSYSTVYVFSNNRWHFMMYVCIDIWPLDKEEWIKKEEFDFTCYKFFSYIEWWHYWSFFYYRESLSKEISYSVASTFSLSLSPFRWVL